MNLLISCDSDGVQAYYLLNNDEFNNPVIEDSINNIPNDRRFTRMSALIRYVNENQINIRREHSYIEESGVMY